MHKFLARYFYQVYQIFHSLFFFFSVTLRWISLAEPKEKDPQYACAPFQRYGHTAVVYNNNVYIWGGRNDEYGCNTLFCFNTGILIYLIIM